MISSRNMKHLMEVKEKLGNIIANKSIISSLMNKLALLFYKRKRDFIGRAVFSMVLHFLLA